MSGTVQICMMPGCAGPGVLMCEPCRFCVCLAHVITHCSTPGQHDPLKYLVEDNKQAIGMIPTPTDDTDDGFSSQPEASPSHMAPPSAQTNRSIPPLTFDPVMPSDDVGSPDQSRSGMPPVPQQVAMNYPFYPAFNGTGAIGPAFPVSVNAFSQGPVMMDDQTISAPAPVPDSEPLKKKATAKRKKAPHAPTACGCIRVPTPPSFASQDREKKIDRVNKRSETYISCERGYLCLPLRTKGDTKYFISCRELNAAVSHSIQFRFNISHAKDPKVADPKVVRDLYAGATHYWVIDAPVVSAAEINAHRALGLLLTYCFKGMKLMLRSAHAKRVRVHDKDYQKHDQLAFPIEIWFKASGSADEFSFYQTFCAFRQRQKPAVATPRVGNKRARFVPLSTSDNFDVCSQDEEKCEPSDDETEPTVLSPNSSVMTPAAPTDAFRSGIPAGFKVDASQPTDQLSERSSPTLGAMVGDVANMQLGAGASMMLPTASSGSAAATGQSLAFPPLQQLHSNQSSMGMQGGVPSFSQPFMPFPNGYPGFPSMLPGRNLPQSSPQMPMFSAEVKPEPHSGPFTQPQMSSSFGGLPFMGMPSGFSGFPPALLAQQNPVSREDSIGYVQQLLSRTEPRPQPDFARLATFSVDNMSFYLNRSVLDRMGDIQSLDPVTQSLRMTSVVAGIWRSPHQVAEFRLLSNRIHPGHAMLVVEYEGESFSAQQQRLLMNCEATQAMFYLGADLAAKISAHTRKAFQNHDAVIHLFIDNIELYRFFFDVHILAPSLMTLPRPSNFGNPSSSDPSGRGGFGGMGGPGPSGGNGGEGFGGNGPSGFNFGGFSGPMGHGGVGGGRHLSAAMPNSNGPFANAALCHDSASVIWDGSSSECTLRFAIEPACASDSKQQPAMPTLEQIRSCVLLCPTESRPLKLAASATLSTARSLVFVIRADLQSKYWPNAYCDERAVIVPLRVQFQGAELLHSSFSISIESEVPSLAPEHTNLSECLVDVSEDLSSLSPVQADIAEYCVSHCIKTEGPSAELVSSHLREGRYADAVISAVCASVVASAKSSRGELSLQTRELARLLRPLTLDDRETAQLASAVPAPSSPVRPASQRSPRGGETCTAASPLELSARFLSNTIIYDSDSQSTVQLTVRCPSLSTLADLEAALTPQSLALHFLSESNTTVTRAPHSIVCHGSAPFSATVSFAFPSSAQQALWPNAYSEERDLVSPCWLRYGDQILTRGTFSLRAVQGEGSSVQSLIGEGSEPTALTHCLVDVSPELELLDPTDSSLIEQILKGHANHRIHSSQRFLSLMGEGQYSDAILQAIVDAVAHYADVGHSQRPDTLGLSLVGCVKLLDAYLNTLLPSSESEPSDDSEEIEDLTSFAAIKPSDLFAPVSSSSAATSSSNNNSGANNSLKQPHHATKTGEISPTNLTPTPLSSTPPSEHFLSGPASTPAPHLRPVSPPKAASRSTASPVPQPPKPVVQRSAGFPFSQQDALMLLGALRMQMPPQIPPTSCAQEVRPFHRNDAMSLMSEPSRSGPSTSHNPSAHPQAPGHHTSSHIASGSAPGSSASGKTSPPPAAYNSGQLLTMSVSSQVSSSLTAGSASHADFPPLPAEMTVADCTRAFKELCAQLYYAHTPADIVHLRQAYGRLTSLAAVVRDHFYNSRSEESRRLYHEMVDYARQLGDRLELLGSLEDQRK